MRERRPGDWDSPPWLWHPRQSAKPGHIRHPKWVDAAILSWIALGMLLGLIYSLAVLFRS